MEGSLKMPRVAMVKNEAPVGIDITADRLLREATGRNPPPPKRKIYYYYYELWKRTAFEDTIHRNGNVLSNWLKYARWEESQKRIARARSVYERAMDVDYKNVTLWLKYVGMEMRHRQVNHARNIWDRAVTILPRENQLWYKYAFMEEMLENISGARQIFDRWMEWEPHAQAWKKYIKFELRNGEIERARTVYQRFVIIHPEVEHWIKYARFEETHGFICGARRAYERGIIFHGDENISESLFIAFARFEERQNELKRARIIYEYAIKKLPKDRSHEISKAYSIHENKYGDRSGIKDVIVSKKIHQYEQEVKHNPSNYDAWFDYLKLLESEGYLNHDEARDIFERAIANVPPKKSKESWKKYIYLWIKYALFEELETKDIERCRKVFGACFDLIPHRTFTFPKIWLLSAKFEIRQNNITKAREILENGIATCPKTKLYREYINLEIQLREFDRVRKLYEKFLFFDSKNSITWIKYAEFEILLWEIDRARAIFKLAISQPALDKPEVLWETFIDFEISQDEPQNARELFEKLLKRTSHVKVWMTYAKFELENSVVGEGVDSVVLARRIFERGNISLRTAGDNENRALLLEAWRDFENENGDVDSLLKVLGKMPEITKKRRRVMGENDSDGGWEEVSSFTFPEDKTQASNLKILGEASYISQQMIENVRIVSSL